MTVLGFHHVLLAMPAGEEEKAVAFYEGVLGIPQLEKPESLRDRAAAGSTTARSRSTSVSRRAFGPPARPTLPCWSATWPCNPGRLEDFGAELEYQPVRGLRLIHAYDPSATVSSCSSP